MASNLTGQVAQHCGSGLPLLPAAIFRARSQSTFRGEILQLKEAINTMVDQLRSFASEVTRCGARSGYRW